MEPTTRKQQLKEELLHLLRRDLEAVEHAQRMSLEGATHEEARAENDKDTRALELSYLARGQAVRTQELQSAVADITALSVAPLSGQAPIVSGALVTVEMDDDQQKLFFIAPHGGGARLKGQVQVVTLQSPLGQALLGRRSGESTEAFLAGKNRELTVLSVE